MKQRDQFFLLPYLVVFFINLAVLVVFVSYLVSEFWQWTKLFYFVLVVLIAIGIYFLRIKIIGKTTILDRFSNDPKFGQGLVGFVSLVVAILLTTLLIVKSSWGIFLSDFKELDFTPVKWFEYLGNNYQQISLYIILIFIVFYIIFLLLSLLPFSDERIKLQLISILTAMVVFILFTSEIFMSYFNNFLELKVVNLILSVMLGGSLIYFNLFFLLRKSKDNL